jgi:hypothetical protein
LLSPLKLSWFVSRHCQDDNIDESCRCQDYL